MRNILYLLNLLFTCLLFVIKESVCQFKAVSYVEWMGNLYLSLRGEADIGHPRLPEEIYQTQICNDIVSSKFWKQRFEVIPPDKMWAKLNQKKNKHIFYQLYRKKETTSSPLIRFGLKKKSDYYFSNPYITRKVVFEKLEGGRIVTSSSEEHVFLCVLKNMETRDAEAWYISREYVSREGVPLRFSFYFFQEVIRTGEIILKLGLLAEEPAKVLEDDDLRIERYYLNLKKEHQRASNKELDPLCQQARQYGQISRFCTGILSSTYFDDKIDHLIFVAQLIENQCTEKEIVFQTEDAKKEAGERSFKEWMILCTAKMIDTNSTMYFYISRAYVSGQAFLFSSDSFYNDVQLVKRFTNVSLHDEGSTSTGTQSMNAQLKNIRSTDAQIEDRTPNMGQTKGVQIENMRPNISQSEDTQIEKSDAQAQNMTSKLSQNTEAQVENIRPNISQSEDTQINKSDTQSENMTPKLSQNEDTKVENIRSNISQSEGTQINKSDAQEGGIAPKLSQSTNIHSENVGSNVSQTDDTQIRKSDAQFENMTSKLGQSADIKTENMRSNISQSEDTQTEKSDAQVDNMTPKSNQSMNVQVENVRPNNSQSEDAIKKKT